MSLTDDWKAGKLGIGQYYVAYKGGRYGIENLIEPYDYYGFDNNSANIIVEVLAPVPSYEKLQEMKSQIKHLKDLQANEDKEIERLRDLLKECKRYIDIIYTAAEHKDLDNHEDTAYIDGKELLTRINAAIGESEEK